MPASVLCTLIHLQPLRRKAVLFSLTSGFKKSYRKGKNSAESWAVSINVLTPESILLTTQYYTA